MSRAGHPRTGRPWGSCWPRRSSPHHPEPRQEDFLEGPHRTKGAPLRAVAHAAAHRWQWSSEKLESAPRAGEESGGCSEETAKPQTKGSQKQYGPPWEFAIFSCPGLEAPNFKKWKKVKRGLSSKLQKFFQRQPRGAHGGLRIVRFSINIRPRAPSGLRLRQLGEEGNQIVVGAESASPQAAGMRRRHPRRGGEGQRGHVQRGGRRAGGGCGWRGAATWRCRAAGGGAWTRARERLTTGPTGGDWRTPRGGGGSGVGQAGSVPKWLPRGFSWGGFALFLSFFFFF